MPLTDERIARLKAAGYQIFRDVEGMLDAMDEAMGKLPPHLERVRAEKAELDGRIRNLEAFLERDVMPQSMTPREYDILVRQLVVMDALSQILQERLNLWEKANA